MFVHHELRFAIATETLFTGFHGTITGSDGHRTKLNAGTTLLTEIGADAEGVVYMTVITPTDEANCPGFPDLGTSPHTATT
jgi:hypothetical protein